ncbi:MAG TPA: hypothetical protein VFF79_16930 [Conexibacter sp.]|nr:hypothetical protein [Conexibacter sp.]
MATEDHPELTLEGVSHEEAIKITRGLMTGPGSSEYGHVVAAVRATSTHESMAA